MEFNKWDRIFSPESPIQTLSLFNLLLRYSNQNTVAILPRVQNIYWMLSTPTSLLTCLISILTFDTGQTVLECHANSYKRIETTGR